MSEQGQVDFRQQQLEQWVADALGVERIQGRPASSDASFRRYFRFEHEARSLIAMDAPPATEDCRPFVAVADLFGRAGVHVPEILAEDLERGFLLLSDLGAKTYLELLSDSNADPFSIRGAGSSLARQLTRIPHAAIGHRHRRQEPAQAPLPRPSSISARPHLAVSHGLLSLEVCRNCP